MPRLPFVPLLLPLLLALGCAEDANEGIVTGTVLVDGQPAKTGAITYIPVDGKSPTSGTSIENGEYTARVPVGTMKVQIHVPKVVGEYRAYPDAPPTPLEAESLPPKYNIETTLQIDVQPGENTEHYDLKTDE